MLDQKYCAVPFSVGFLKDNMNFRNCCSVDPQIQSTGESFSEWWSGDKMNSFREEFKKGLPNACLRCKHQEDNGITSFRQSINKQVGIKNLNNKNLQWPSRWNISFGNTCNLGCWICGENSSSYIENQKRKLGLLDSGYTSPRDKFSKIWQNLKQDVLKSYNEHNTVTITLLGGEPLYNKNVINFLHDLTDLGLQARTRLEFHTNATVMNNNIEKLLDQNWQYVCIFFSLDAAGRKAEWLRYNCSWDKIEKNVPRMMKVANYTEVHCTVSIMNIMDLACLQEYCDNINIPLKASLLSSPDFLSLSSWPLAPEILVNRSDLGHYSGFYDLIGTKPDETAVEKFKNHINQFNTVREPVENFDKKFAEILKII